MSLPKDGAVPPCRQCPYSRTFGRVTAAELAPNSGLLTRREAEVLAHLALRMTAKEIASALLVSHRTVERHIGNVYEKLDVHDRETLLRRLLRPAPLGHDPRTVASTSAQPDRRLRP
jgi:DNA-binding NarL/FixJ family response regulator